MEKIVVVGSGGREHALAHKLAFGHSENPAMKREVLLLWGNPGIAREYECVMPEPGLDGCIKAIRRIEPELVVVGPENYLADGLIDALKEQKIAAFGPTKHAAQLESSKAFTKEICALSKIPAASYARFSDLKAAQQFVSAYPHEGLVIKVDGLCAGKGVFVVKKQEAMNTLDYLYAQNGFSDLFVSDPTIIIEDYLEGSEVSVFGAAQGDDVALFCPMQDYKRLRDGDQGPNTGGMGSLGPLGHTHAERQAFLNRIKETIFLPALATMKQRGMPFFGLLYAGCMLTKQGPKLLEFNVRFGDPETQSLLFGTRCDIYPLLLGIAKGQSLDMNQWQDDLLDMEAAVTIVLASRNYPNASTLQSEISLPTTHQAGCKVFFAKTALDRASNLVSDSGRVLNVCAKAPTIEQARTMGYSLLSQIHFSGMQYRMDIGTNITEFTNFPLEE